MVLLVASTRNRHHVQWAKDELVVNPFLGTGCEQNSGVVVFVQAFQVLSNIAFTSNQAIFHSPLGTNVAHITFPCVNSKSRFQLRETLASPLSIKLRYCLQLFPNSLTCSFCVIFNRVGPECLDCIPNEVSDYTSQILNDTRAKREVLHKHPHNNNGRKVGGQSCEARQVGENHRTRLLLHPKCACSIQGASQAMKCQAAGHGT
mmetsp:Transcript_38155/g.59558  ORF Transcript_38155/g.59558 Transcript_38155/m.59558 type:complete len:204 (-) Transcript_38155:873-1484(-)